MGTNDILSIVIICITIMIIVLIVCFTDIIINHNNQVCLLKIDGDTQLYDIFLTTDNIKFKGKININIPCNMIKYLK